MNLLRIVFILMIGILSACSWMGSHSGGCTCAEKGAAHSEGRCGCAEGECHCGHHHKS